LITRMMMMTTRMARLVVDDDARRRARGGCTRARASRRAVVAKIDVGAANHGGRPPRGEAASAARVL